VFCEKRNFSKSPGRKRVGRYKTRGKYVPVRSAAASLPQTVLYRPTRFLLQFMALPAVIERLPKNFVSFTRANKKARPVTHFVAPQKAVNWQAPLVRDAVGLCPLQLSPKGRKSTSFCFPEERNTKKHID